MPKPSAWLCWSSGKDSAWALHTVRQQGEVEVVGLLTTVTEPYQRVAMHGVRESLLAAQADAAGLPLIRVPIPAPCPNEVYQQAMGQAIVEAKRQGVTHMIFGDLFLEEIRQYRQRQLEGTGMTPLFPLWKQPTATQAQAMIAAGVVAYVTCLDPKRVSRDLAGHRFDQQLLARLGPDVDPCAENGEFHTCVTAGPMFRHPIPVVVGPTVEREGFVFTDLTLDDPGPCRPS
ncbi:MAG: ATP-binding protein [Thermoguttaceae bacterium]